MQRQTRFVVGGNITFPLLTKWVFSRRCAHIAETLFNNVIEKDVQTAIKRYRELKATRQDAYDFSEPQLNRFGYHSRR